MMRFTLGKDEKLKSKILIGKLFAEGDHVKSFPLRLIYLKENNPSNSPIQVGFSVPKRNVNLAVDRIRIKRLMREVYRKNKHRFSDEIKNQYIFMFIYMAKKEIKYKDLELVFEKLISKFLIKIKDDDKV